MANKKRPQNLHVAMCPWFALGHISVFLHLANKLAKRGHKVSFFMPPKAQDKFASKNHHPTLITIIPIVVPSVNGLPPGAETTNDVTPSARPFLMTAMDLTRDTIQSHLARLRPDFVLFDFSHWLPGLARELGIKSMYFISAYMVSVAYFNPLATVDSQHHDSGSRSPLDPPPSFPSSVIRLRAPEIRLLTGVRTMVDADGGLTFPERIRICFRECDAIGVNTCKEMEGHYCDCLRKQAGKPVALAGPVVPRPEPSRLDDYIDCWLKSFSRGSVVYCALGSEYAMEKDQFLELVLGLELTGKPFLAALKPPKDYDTVESALPEGFTERTKGRGIIHGGWVQQQLILHHGSVGCFVTHCGSGSLAEALVSKCQIVMMPQVVDQFFHARMMSLELKVGVEVKRRDEDGLFTREAIDEAVAKMMDEESEVGREMRINHTKWRDLLLSEGLEESYMSTFIQSLQDMLG